VTSTSLISVIFITEDPTAERIITARNQDGYTKQFIQLSSLHFYLIGHKKMMLGDKVPAKSGYLLPSVPAILAIYGLF
jgi:hypothetical protein